MTTRDVAVVVGSLRKESFNRKAARAGVQPEGFKWKHKEGKGLRHLRHYPGEVLGRLPHYAVEGC